MTHNITHLVAHFPPESYGGMETHVRGLASRLSSSDDLDITVVSTTDNNLDDDFDFQVRRARRIGTVGKAAIAPSLLLHIAQSDPDLIHVHVPFHGGLEAAFLYQALIDVPVVCTIHMYGWDPSIVHRFYTKFMENPILRESDAIVGSTEDYLSQFPIFETLSDQVRIIPHAVDTEQFSPASEEKCSLFRDEHQIPVDEDVVLFVGSLDEGHYYKRLDWLLEAMVSVLQTNPDTHLLVVGKGNRKGSFETLTRKLGIQDSVTFTGFLPDSKMPTAYTVADVFVLPSEPDLSESFGIVQLEAMACNTPVIATDTPGPRSVAQEGGLVFSPNDIDELSRKIVQLLTEESLSPRSLVLNQYSWEIIVEKWHKLYEDQIGESNE